eukprot:gene10093-7062_t
MHIYSRDQQAFHLKRTELERWFSRLNTLVIGMNVVCFITSVIRLGTGASNTMTNSFFSYSALNLSPEYLVEGCTFQVTQSKSAFQDVTYVMRPENIAYFVSRHVLQVRFLLAVAGCHAAISLANRCCFEFNIHELRYNFVVFKKDVLTMWEILLLVMGCFLVLNINQENRHILDYLMHCNKSSTIIKSYNTVIPVLELEISLFGTAAILGINALVAAFNLLSHPNPMKELLKRDAEQQREYEEIQRQQATHAGRDGSTEPDASGSSAISSQTPHAGGFSADHPSSMASPVSLAADGTAHQATFGTMGASVSAPVVENSLSNTGAAGAVDPAQPVAAMEVEHDGNADADMQLLERLKRQQGNRRGAEPPLPPPPRLRPPSFDASSSAMEEDDLGGTGWSPRPVLDSGRPPSIVSATHSVGEAHRHSNPPAVHRRRAARGSERMSVENGDLSADTEDTIRF